MQKEISWDFIIMTEAGSKIVIIYQHHHVAHFLLSHRAIALYGVTKVNYLIAAPHEQIFFRYLIIDEHNKEINIDAF